ncbi:MAG: hypothetical protein K6F53_07370 [Lachnospiraceae bacterium]|nr:hypothetical protein [Lachnospiraceae bacterium]
MDIERITEENVQEYMDHLSPDMAESMGREYFRGIGLKENGAPEGALIWEIKNAEDEDADRESELMFLGLADTADGGELFRVYSDEAEEEEVVRTFFELPDTDPSLEKLLSGQGFSVKNTESRDIIVTVGELSSLDLSKGKVPPYVCGVGELMARQYRRGIMNCLFQKRKGLLEDIGELPMSFFDQEVSSCVITDEKVNGFLLVHQTAGGMLVVELMASFEPDAAVNMAMMMRRSITEAANLYPADTKVLLRRHNDQTRQLSARLFPKKKGETVLAGERKE